MKLYYCQTPTGVKIYSLNKLIGKQKNGVDLKILDVASYDDLCALREQLSEANDIIKYYAEKHGKLKACDYLNKWGIK